jgi:hypothetical protein
MIYELEENMAASVQQWPEKIWLCSLNDDFKTER